MKANHTLISVIIPTYCPDKYLYECLDSIRQQDLPHNEMEVLIILNGDKQPYYDDIKNYLSAKEFDFEVKIIYSEIKGVSNARNKGIEMARGVYIAFIDDDDLITPNYLSDLLKISDKDTIAISNIVLLNDENKTYSIDYPASKAFVILSKKGYNRIFDVRRVLNGPWMKLFPKNIIKDVRFNPNIALGEDALFSFTISKNVKHFRFTSEEAKYIYRIRQGSSWSKKSFRQLNSNMIDLLCQYTSIYFSDMSKYSFSYYLSRLAAVIIRFCPYLIKSIQK